MGNSSNFSRFSSKPLIFADAISERYTKKDHGDIDMRLSHKLGMADAMRSPPMKNRNWLVVDLPL